MGSFEWMELQTLTSDINASRSRLAAARANRDNRLIRVLEQEITEAEARRDRLLASITTNLAAASEASHNPSSAQQVAEAPPAEAAAAEAPVEEPAASVANVEPPAEEAAAAAAPEAGETATAASDEPVAEAANGAPAGVASRADGTEGGMVVWDQLTPSDIERAQAELGERRAAMLARHAEELKALEVEQAELELLEKAIDSFLRRLGKGSAADAQADVVKLGASAA